MKKAIFTNEIFYWALIIFITSLLTTNFVALLKYSMSMALLPITIEMVLLSFIFTKHKYVKIALQVWVVVFLIVAYGLQIVGTVMQFLGGKRHFNGADFVENICMLSTGIAFLAFINRTIVVPEQEKREEEIEDDEDTGDLLDSPSVDDVSEIQ